MTRILNNDNDPVNGIFSSLPFFLSLSIERTNESPTMTERMGSSSIRITRVYEYRFESEEEEFCQVN